MVLVFNGDDAIIEPAFANKIGGLFVPISATLFGGVLLFSQVPLDFFITMVFGGLWVIVVWSTIYSVFVKITLQKNNNSFVVRKPKFLFDSLGIIWIGWETLIKNSKLKEIKSKEFSYTNPTNAFHKILFKSAELVFEDGSTIIPSTLPMLSLSKQELAELGKKFNVKSS